MTGRIFEICARSHNAEDGLKGKSYGWVYFDCEPNTSVDQAIMASKSLPVDKAVNDEVFCGAMNCFGAIDITATDMGIDFTYFFCIGSSCSLRCIYEDPA